MNAEVNDYIENMTRWKSETKKLRSILLERKLIEQLKWKKPCYCYKDCNIAIIQPFKDKIGLMFFKGVLLKDSKKLLIANGENSQAAKRFEFRELDEIKRHQSIIKEYIQEAILIEESGKKITPRSSPEKIPSELEKAFEDDLQLKNAFFSLTPGRQRGYILYIKDAKQSTTRSNRIEKCRPKILMGKGLQD